MNRRISKLEEYIWRMDNDILGNNTNNIGSNSRDTDKCEQEVTKCQRKKLIWLLGHDGKKGGQKR